MADYMINCDDFVALFITLKQLEFSSKQFSRLYLSMECSFSLESLSSFICYSQRNPKYIKLLEAFDVVIDSFNGEIAHVINAKLMMALNKAMQKHLLTTIAGDIAYISRSYMNPNILREYYYLEGIMKDFIRDFDAFVINPTIYLDEVQMVASGSEQAAAQNERDIYNLQRKMRYGNGE